MKISIITATYNSESTLPATLRSIVEQTFQSIEHIIIDGASTDSTLSIIRDYAAQHPGVTYLSEKDNGIYSAINKGVSLATGDVIGILNSDDILADNSVLQTIAEAFSHTGTQAVYGDLMYCKGDSIVRYWKSNSFDMRELRFGWMPAHPTFYCRREVYNALGHYDEHLRISADYDFMLRVLKHGYHAEYIPKVLVKMQLGGISNRSPRTMWCKSCEDVVALRNNHVGCGWLTIFVKNIRKIAQFIR